MIAKSLHFGKALNAALLVLLLAVGTTKAFAQTQVATLEHGDDISAFYGVNALIDAHEAAVDGDVITLSSGQFFATNITKAITLHGAGVITESVTQTTPTYVSGNFEISISNEEIPLNVEGIFFQNTITTTNCTLHHGSFIRCNIQEITNDNNGKMGDVQFVNCLINQAVYLKSLNNNVIIINCVIGTMNLYNNTSAIYVYNSMVRFSQSYQHPMTYIYNSIIGGGGLTTSYVYNSIGIGNVLGGSIQSFNCMSANNYTDVFNTFNGTFAFDADYTLKEDIATTFLGIDGREVGIYGGAMPYNPRPSYLVLSRFNVAGKSTIDGKLSVEIEIINEE